MKPDHVKALLSMNDPFDVCDHVISGKRTWEKRWDKSGGKSQDKNLQARKQLRRKNRVQNLHGTYWALYVYISYIKNT